MQSPTSVLMIRPVMFGFNEQTESSNHFQNRIINLNQADLQALALKEFDGFVAILKANGVNVIVFDDTIEPHTPDSIFPNNWISFHEDGTVILYPMFALNRRLERRGDLLVSLQVDHHFDIRNIIDLSHFEKDQKFLEGTGSVIFDYVNKIAYCNISVRSDFEVLHKMALALNYEVVSFHAVHENGAAIYHANVLMCIGEKFAIVCLATLKDESERLKVTARLKSTGHEIVDISYAQMNSFAGNALQLKNDKGENLLVMSSTASNSLSKSQKEVLTRYARIVDANITTIETTGGGSVRCMIAGLHLPDLKPENYIKE